MPRTVGFDLDLTLIDARPGMIALIDQLSEETGVPLDAAFFAANLGPPVEVLLRGAGAPEAAIPALADRYRALYPAIVLPTTVPMPGAREALAAVRARGARIVVVTGKHQPNAAKHLRAFGWEVDDLVGGLWAEGKAIALREHDAEIYVGDHVGDMHGARAAGAIAVGVATGPCTEAELRAAGAEFVLADLTGFADWLTVSAR
ncbi:MAG TPA: HAD hydrolase-like protein [Pseudonocardiaceae bacterium]|nr:HAD hydrolase-like protein [Pseudonocardiaceae bacterium]